MTERGKTLGSPVVRVRSDELAAILVDALGDAGIVRSADVERAIAIVTEEVDVRRALGDG
jgi:hypothetical protein